MCVNANKMLIFIIYLLFPLDFVFSSITNVPDSLVVPETTTEIYKPTEKFELPPFSSSSSKTQADIDFIHRNRRDALSDADSNLMQLNEISTSPLEFPVVMEQNEFDDNNRFVDKIVNMDYT